jgi:L,D-transpeptidase ErfK/SrfK
MRFLRNIFVVGLMLIPLVGMARYSRRYSMRLCRDSRYICHRVRRGQSWGRLFPDPQKRRIVMRVNRMNTRIWPGLRIAIPKNLNNINHMDVSPMPYSITALGKNSVYIDLHKQAFGAYDRFGNLIHWGPVSGGKGWCSDSGPCGTPRGNFYVVWKKGADCVSETFPKPTGGAPMPYCMFFYRGYAMHGSYLPGYHASHGCVRMFYEDAQWLHKHFVKLGRKNRTLVVVR